MNDAYCVLGVSRDDTEDEIKKAYRNKAFEVENSNLSDSEKQVKMAELDSAYDFVFNEKRGTNYSSQSNYSETQFPDVRQQINTGRIDDAETILNGIPENMRSAEWNYLKGLVHKSRGWLNEAYACFSAAVSMEPDNAEYRAAYDSMTKKANGGYRVKNDDSKSSGWCDYCDCCDCCDCCGGDCCSDLCTLWCCDNICECFGGDLCGCC